jgi:hypothetical protein
MSNSTAGVHRGIRHRIGIAAHCTRPLASATGDNICRMIHVTNFEDQPPPAVGAYWIKEEGYPALLKIFDDVVKMPRTWKEWLKIAEEMERGLKDYGHVVMRVHIDPNTFPNWCPWHEPRVVKDAKGLSLRL